MSNQLQILQQLKSRKGHVNNVTPEQQFSSLLSKEGNIVQCHKFLRESFKKNIEDLQNQTKKLMENEIKESFGKTQNQVRFASSAAAQPSSAQKEPRWKRNTFIPHSFQRAQAFTRDENNNKTPYMNWEVFWSGHNVPNQQVMGIADISEKLPPKDERIYGYKGVYNRMNQGGINDIFGVIDTEQKIFGEEMFVDTTEVQIELDRIEQMMNAKPKPVKPMQKVADKYLKREPIEHPYSVVIERIDPTDPEVIEQKRMWIKDRPHFDYVKVFQDIIKVREERKQIEKQYGIKNPCQLDELVEHMKIANGEMMDPEEEQAHLKRLLKRNKQGKKIPPPMSPESELVKSTPSKAKEQMLNQGGTFKMTKRKTTIKGQGTTISIKVGKGANAAKPSSRKPRASTRRGDKSHDAPSHAAKARDQQGTGEPFKKIVKVESSKMFDTYTKKQVKNRLSSIGKKKKSKMKQPLDSSSSSSDSFGFINSNQMSSIQTGHHSSDSSYEGNQNPFLQQEKQIQNARKFTIQRTKEEKARLKDFLNNYYPYYLRMKNRKKLKEQQQQALQQGVTLRKSPTVPTEMNTTINRESVSTKSKKRESYSRTMTKVSEGSMKRFRGTATLASSRLQTGPSFDTTTLKPGSFSRQPANFGKKVSEVKIEDNASFFQGYDRRVHPTSQTLSRRVSEQRETVPEIKRDLVRQLLNRNHDIFGEGGTSRMGAASTYSAAMYQTVQNNATSLDRKDEIISQIQDLREVWELSRSKVEYLRRVPHRAQSRGGVRPPRNLVDLSVGKSISGVNRSNQQFAQRSVYNRFREHPLKGSFIRTKFRGSRSSSSTKYRQSSNQTLKNLKNQPSSTTHSAEKKFRGRKGKKGHGISAGEKAIHVESQDVSPNLNDPVRQTYPQPSSKDPTSKTKTPITSNARSSTNSYYGEQRTSSKSNSRDSASRLESKNQRQRIVDQLREGINNAKDAHEKSREGTKRVFFGGFSSLTRQRNKRMEDLKDREREQEMIEDLKFYFKESEAIKIARENTKKQKTFDKKSKKKKHPHTDSQTDMTSEVQTSGPKKSSILGSAYQESPNINSSQRKDSMIRLSSVGDSTPGKNQRNETRISIKEIE